MPQSLSLVVLAGGQGRRFLSKKNKILHLLGGQPVLAHVLQAAITLKPSEIVLVASPQLAREEDLSTLIQPYSDVRLSIQDQAKGTADALLCAFKSAPPKGEAIMTLLGDVPLIQPCTLEALQNHAHQKQADVCLISMNPPNPSGYGRCVLDKDGMLARIVEEADATQDEKRITRCNSGLWWLRRDTLSELSTISPSKGTGEVYLTDLIAKLREKNHACLTLDAPFETVLGINTRSDLAHAEALYQNTLRQKAMESGATLRDPSSIFLSFDTRVASDVTIEPFVTIGPNVRIESGATIHSHTHIRATHVGKNASVGPFASIVDNTHLEENVTIGSFVEGKRLTMKKGAKAKHLSYLGDASVGSFANIGAGVITCNYDGFKKNIKHIGAGAFVGANASLIAPLNVGQGALIGAGSVITQDVPTGSLALGRAHQVIKKVKKNLCAES